MINAYSDSPIFVKKFVDDTLEHEGGYVNNPDDNGGETNWGITKRVAESFSDYWENYNWDGEMATMPRVFAQDLYVYEYYYRPKFNLMEEESKLISKELFDTGVNMGTSKPVKFLQRVLNVSTDGEALVVDGLLGNKTVESYRKLCNKRGETVAENFVYNCLNSLQCVNYIEIAERDKTQESFVFGWITNRVDYQPF